MWIELLFSTQYVSISIYLFGLLNEEMNEMLNGLLRVPRMHVLHAAVQ